VLSRSRSIAGDRVRLSEVVPGYDVSKLDGYWHVARTPASAVETLNKEINAVLAEPAIRSQLILFGLDPKPMTAADFDKVIAGDAEKWAEVVQSAGIRVD
jgi:tripartite-type tricarboxylate transporter receptor subunit TctC